VASTTRIARDTGVAVGAKESSGNGERRDRGAHSVGENPHGMEHDDERQWIERAVAGDPAAFDALLDRHLDPVRCFLQRLGVGSSDLDDATQETFVTAIEKLAHYRAESRFRTWLFGIAVHVARAAWRRRAARARANAPGETGEAVPEPSCEAPPGAAIEGAELAATLTRLLRRLSEPLREAFVLRHVEELTAADAARVAGVPEGTLRRRAHEAREQLKVWLAAAEISR
jgi:RNA polymerase sigma factor (sigma-70 family)